MPPKSQRIKSIKTSKENILHATRATQKNVKAPRKALSDKTNSASDDNGPSPTNPKLGIQTRKMTRTKVVSISENKIVKIRPNRNQKLLKSLSENQVLKFINNKSRAENQDIFQKKPVVLLEKLRMCDRIVETNIADSRPKRICRLPTKFENHFISPSKCVPVQPIQTSTPIVQNKHTKIKSIASSNDSSSSIEASSSSYNSSTEKPKRSTRYTKYKPNNPTQEKKKPTKKNTGSNKKQADTNNNANDLNQEQRLCNMQTPCNDVNKLSKKRMINKDYSIRAFDEQTDARKRNANNLDVYEFTYDPAQEPPEKKKRKRIVKKKQERPKPFFNNNYNKNIAKTLTTLKSVLTKKSEAKLQTKPPVTQTVQNKPLDAHNVNENMVKVSQNAVNAEGNGLQQNFNSFNVENIVLNDVSVANDYNDINYSPVQSPDHVIQPSEPTNDVCTVEGVIANNDPLNIQEEISFFDDHPVASSSMNVSTRNPSATPWRAEYEQLPIKWQVNTYVKPNMTPALESSFIHFDNRKKHVYTNMVPEDNIPLPEIIETEPVSKLKQTSIISFFKEVVERQNNKKSKLKTTPVKVNSIEAINPNNSQVLPASEPASNSVNKSITPQKMSSKTPIRGTDMSVSDKENSTELHAAQTNSPIKSKEKKTRQYEKKNKDITFFGFDDSEEQENVSPVKKIDKRQVTLKPHSRAILQEFNNQNGPSRLLLGAKNKKDKNANINKVNVEVIETSDQNLFQEKVIESVEETNNAKNGIEDCIINLSPEDSQSVHLFEDLEVVHHLKPVRKSYGKAKKVAFQQPSDSSDTQEVEVQQDANSSAEEDNLDDLTFEIPSAQTKKQRKKKKTNKQRSKKEDKEVEEWAAGFNSMCEDIDNFDLIVE